MIDAKEEIIQALLEALENNPEQYQITEMEIRNLIGLLINTQFDNNLRNTQSKVKVLVENILDLRYRG